MKNVTTLVGLGATALLMTACSVTTGGESGTKTVESADKLKGTIAYLTPSQTVVRWSKYEAPQV